MKFIIQLIKKLSLHLFLCMMFFNSAFAEIIDLGNDVKINIPNNYEYIQVPYKKYYIWNSRELGINQKYIDESYDIQKREFAYTGTEIATFIGKKGFKNAYGKVIEESLKGNISTVNSLENDAIASCQHKKTYKKKIFCFMEKLKIDPYIEIVKSNNISFSFKQLNEILSKPLTPLDKKEFSKLKKEFKGNKWKKISLSKNYKSKMKLKFYINDDKQWFVEIIGIENNMGFLAKRHGYFLTVNDYVLVINTYSFCLKLKECKNYDHVMNKILEPSFSPTTFAQGFDLKKKDDMLKLIATKNGQNFYKLAEHIMTKLQY